MIPRRSGGGGGARKGRVRRSVDVGRGAEERKRPFRSLAKRAGRKIERDRSSKENRRVTSYGGVESVQICERQRHRSKVHHDFVGPSRFAESVLVSRHEYTGVTSSYVETARVVQGELERAVQSALDRSLHANVQLSLSQFLHLPGKYILGLMYLLQEDRVVPNSGGQIRATFE